MKNVELLKKLLGLEMTTRLKVLLVLLVATIVYSVSCTNTRFVRHYKNIDPEFKAYVHYFVSASRGTVKHEDIKNITMGFRDFDKKDRTVGVCHPMLFFTEIDINRKWWYESSPMERMELIFHELGHCVLHRGHTDFLEHRFVEKILFKIGVFTKKEDLLDGCPPSIMNPTVIDEFCFTKHFSYYLQELFQEKTYLEYHMRRHYFTDSRCGKAKVINDTKEWTDLDRQTFLRAERNCEKIYRSCLKVFVKKKGGSYNVICGN